MRSSLNNDKGFALISVLWGLAILSLIALSMLGSVRLAYRLDHNEWERSTAESFDEAGINRAILALLDHRQEMRWQTNGTVYDVDIEGHRVMVSIQDELGKIDINAADSALLESLFLSVGLDRTDTARMVDRILDWREPDGPRHLNGAKAAEYRTAGSFYGPRNGPFQSVYELKLILGMTPELYAKMYPALTVYSQQSTVRQASAPPEVLKAMEHYNVPPPSLDITGITAPETSLGGRAFTIRAVTNSDKTPVAVESVVRLTDNPRKPYLVLSWQ